jgi:hypothetical protein
MDILDMPSGNTPEDKSPGVNKQPVPETALDSPLSTEGGLLVQLARDAGVVIPQDKFEALQGFMDHSKYGHQASLPMKCKGLQCPILDLCPLHKLQLTLPIGKTCPVEGALVKQWVTTYLGALDIDPDAPEDAIDMHMVYELAGLELMRTRAAQHLSSNPEIIRTEIIAYSPQGEPIYDDKPSMALLIMEKQAKTVNKLREGLLATRKAQAQVGVMAGDISIRTANMQAKAKEIIARRLKGESIQDVEFEVKDSDEK